MKKIGITLIAIIISAITLAQDANNKNQEPQNKQSEFYLKTGKIKKFQDYSMPILFASMSMQATTRVRQFTYDDQTFYYLQIVKDGKAYKGIASVDYADILEILKAIKTQKDKATAEMATKLNYLETNYITKDGLEVGYFIEEGGGILNNTQKIKWFLKLEKYGYDITYTFNSVDPIETVFLNAKAKIETLNK